LGEGQRNLIGRQKRSNNLESQKVSQITNERGGEEAREESRIKELSGTGGEGRTENGPASLIRDTASLIKMEKRHPEASRFSGKWNPL
jgi:hypothetical protein